MLYDPRSPELVALLDPDASFPAAAFCSNDKSFLTASSAASTTSSAIPGAGGDTTTITAVHPVSPGDEEVDSSSEGVDDDNDGAGSGSSSLAALQQLGLRSTADLMTLVAAAKYVERTARAGDEDMAVARGKVGDTACSACMVALVLPSMMQIIYILAL